MDLSERRSRDTQRHPWELARARFINALLQDQGRQPGAWLDVGAGDGWLAAQISEQLGPGTAMTCWDAFYSPDDLRDLAAEAPHITFTATQPDGRFDAISLFDVIEHVDDDTTFLSEVLDRNLADDGTVFVTVPAHPALFSSHDRALHHFRRYRPRECRDLLERCGLTVASDGGMFATLLAPRAAGVLLERIRPTAVSSEGEAGVGGWAGGPFVTKAINGVLDVDNRLARAASRRTNRYPGLSYWAVCRRA